MNDRKNSRRRRGMHFRPKGGLGQAIQRPDSEAVQARADVVSEQGGMERVFEKHHSHEIERAENMAAGLPPQGAPENAGPNAGADKKDFRAPHLAPPAQVGEEKSFEPVELPEQSKGVLDTFKIAATNLVKKVQRLIRPEKRTHKAIIINAETLETRVAVLEDGKQLTAYCDRECWPKVLK